jgi:hypothetical protein
VVGGKRKGTGKSPASCCARARGCLPKPPENRKERGDGGAPRAARRRAEQPGGAAARERGRELGAGKMGLGLGFHANRRPLIPLSARTAVRLRSDRPERFGTGASRAGAELAAGRVNRPLAGYGQRASRPQSHAPEGRAKLYARVGRGPRELVWDLHSFFCSFISQRHFRQFLGYFLARFCLDFSEQIGPTKYLFRN